MVWSTTRSSLPSDPSDPETISTDSMSVMVAGSTTVSWVTEPWICTGRDCTRDTSPTPVVLAREAATEGESGWNEELVAMKSALITLSMTASVDAVVEAPRTPIISADAVDAVRRGFRRALSMAIRPLAPERRIGSPMTPITRRLSDGLRTTTATKTSSAPNPTMPAALSLARSPDNTTSTPSVCQYALRRWPANA